MENERITFDLSPDALNADWLRAFRLKEANTDEAKKELEELEKTPMVDMNTPFEEEK